MITRLFLWLFWPCRHRWKVVDERFRRNEPGDVLVTGHIYTLQCERCGNIKSREVS